MQRVLIIGGNGSGKSYLARELAELTRLPLCHLDTLYWTDNWKARTRDEFLELLMPELQKPQWILDGNMRATLHLRLKQADTVIYLDYSGIACFFGVLWRLVKNLGKARPDMHEGCVERISCESLRFLFGTLSFNRQNRKNFYAAIAENPHLHLIVLKNRRAAKRYIDELKSKERIG